MFEKLRHWLIPHHTNNYRARLLHNAGLTVLIAAFLSFTAFTRLLDASKLHILGFTSSITADEVIALTNQERLAQGLSPLNLSQKLSAAAAGKAQDMISNGYWAHNSPAGITPWVFITNAGYNYTYAGENLAKDFTNTPRMMQAWMDSATHRANIVSDKYTDIGVAVIPGNLQGQDTVLVVQMFGTTGAATGEVPQQPTIAQIEVQQPAVAGEETKPQPTPEPEEEIAPAEVVTPAQAAEIVGTFDYFNVKRTAAIATTTLMIIVLILDMVIAEFKNLRRRVSKNWAHLIFINVILIAITYIQAGHIL